jgi:predicted permease
MGIRDGVRRFFRLAIRRADLARSDVARELDFHIEERMRQLVAGGMSPDAARREAMLRFGDIDQARSELSESAIRQEAQLTMRDRIDAMLTDLRYVLRTLGRSRGFSAVVVLTFALGIGANAAMFGVVDRLLVRGPAHVVDPEGVHRLYASFNRPGRGLQTHPAVGYVTYTMLKEQSRFVDKAATYGPPYPATIGDGERAERAQLGRAGWDFFPLLGVQPVLGRFYASEEDSPPDGHRVVVLGYDLWQRLFDGDSAVIGKSTRVEGQPYTIIGVAPRGFTGVELGQVDAWVPMTLTHPVTNWPTSWRAQWLSIVVRLKPNTPVSAVNDEVTQLHRRNYGGTDPDRAVAEMSFRSTSFGQAGKEKPETTVSRWLVGVAAIVLLVACANVANLLLARGLARRREVALRLAIGISAARLWRLLLLEGLVLSLVGCVGGLMLAWWGGSLIRTLLLPDVAWTSGPVDARVFLISSLMAIVCGIGVALLPAFQARRIDLAPALKSGSQQAGVPRSRLRTGLLFAQCALSVVLLAGAGVFVTSLQRARSLDLGFRPDRVVRAQDEWPRGADANETARRKAVYMTAVERLREMRGVRHAAVAVATPFGFMMGVDLRVPGWDSLPVLPGGGPYISAVSSDYFDAMGTRLIAGREFEATDRAGSERVTIVNEPMARALWPNEAAVGKCMYIFNDSLPCARVVGVVAEMRRHQLREPSAMQYYVPLGQEVGIGGSALMVQPTGRVKEFAPQIQRLVRELDPTVLYVRTEPMQTALDPLHRQWKLGATLFGVFGLVALGIAALGLYSVIGYLVAQRTSEFGVRLALGATSRRIMSLVMRGGLTVVIAGLVAGLVASLLAGRFIEPLLFETSVRDPVVGATVVVTLLVVAIVACLIPAARASRVNPVTALRAD